MRTRTGGRAVVLIATLLAATVLFMLGRITARPDPEGSPGGRSPQGSDYVAGLRVGAAHGVQEGRALQEGDALPANSRQPVQDAFKAGYAAGANDVFGGYDGGWAVAAPYLVTLEPGGGQLAYRISMRTPVAANVYYFLCPDGHEICRQSRPSP